MGHCEMSGAKKPHLQGRGRARARARAKVRARVRLGLGVEFGLVLGWRRETRGESAGSV